MDDAMAMDEDEDELDDEAEKIINGIEFETGAGKGG